VDLDAIDVERIDAPGHARFDEAYRTLANYFGPRRQLEGPDILRRRLGTQPLVLTRGWTAQYELLILSRNGRIIGVRDHVFFTGRHAAEQTPIYQAHIFVVPEWRGTGVAAWLRALPLISASWWQLQGRLRLVNPSLVAEIDRPRGPHDDAAHALRGYLRAGYGMLPAGIDYLQPDVPDDLTSDASDTCTATPMHLAFRFVGRESSEPRTGEAIARCVEALYSLHEAEFPHQDLEALWRLVARIRAMRSITLLHDGDVAALMDSAAS
jgi:GNAT superfamily N-acetyltransferase